MIQRIQSVWLFLAALPGFLFFFLPIAHFKTAGFQLFANGLEGAEPIIDQLGNIYPAFFVWLLMMIIVATLVLPFITIFKFKDRKKQILLGKLSILLNIILLVVVFLLVDRVAEKSGYPYQFHFLTTCAPIISMIFLFLAVRAIRKDEKLVRAADRIR